MGSSNQRLVTRLGRGHFYMYVSVFVYTVSRGTYGGLLTHGLKENSSQGGVVAHSLGPWKFHSFSLVLHYIFCCSLKCFLKVLFNGRGIISLLILIQKIPLVLLRWVVMFLCSPKPIGGPQEKTIFLRLVGILSY